MQPRDLDLNEVITDLSRMLKRILGEHVDSQLHFAAPCRPSFRPMPA